jgi:glycosyltransferase involved in cell wall biosynthesis
MKFSVVVCAYNEEKYLEKCLNSLKEQDFDKNDYEIIIIDNESLDKTPKISKFFLESNDNKTQIKYFKIKHVGLSSSRNFAVSKCSGDIVVFIDGDAVTDKELLKEYKVVFNNSCDYSGGKICLLNQDSHMANLIQNTKYKQIFHGYNKKNLLHGANMAFRKSIFKNFEFIENFYSRGDDTSFVAILEKNCFLFASSEKSIVYHERPEKISEWLTILKVEFDLIYKVHTLVNQCLNKNSFIFQKSLLGNSFLILLFILSFVDSVFFFAFVAVLLFVKKRHFDFSLNIKEASFAILNLFINIFFTPFMYFLSYIKYKDEKLIEKVDIEIIEKIL